MSAWHRVMAHREHRPGPAARCEAAAATRDRRATNLVVDIPFPMLTDAERARLERVFVADDRTRCYRPEAGAGA